MKPPDLIRNPHECETRAEGMTYGNTEVHVRFDVPNRLLPAFMAWLHGDDNLLDESGSFW